MLTLQCPSCGGKTAFLAGANRLLCQYCGNEHLFELPQNSTIAPSGGITPDDPPLRPKLRPLTLRPNNVKVEQHNQRLSISWSWFSLKYIFLGFFCVAWDSFLCFWYGMAFGMEGAPWIMIVFPVAHVAVGVGLTYTVLAGLFNRTTIEIDRKYFSVRHDPFPWPGEVRTTLGKLTQFYCKEKRSSSDNGTQFSYQLCAMLQDGQELNLVASLDTPDLAKYLEETIESWLQIPDQEVQGELN